MFSRFRGARIHGVALVAGALALVVNPAGTQVHLGTPHYPIA